MRLPGDNPRGPSLLRMSRGCAHPVWSYLLRSYRSKSNSALPDGSASGTTRAPSSRFFYPLCACVM
eukprot:5854667-Prymnesium_polylepis.1